MFDRNQAIELMNHYGSSGTPFLFFTDFPGTKAWVCTANQLTKADISFDFSENSEVLKTDFLFKKNPVSLGAFSKPFQFVVDQINFGNSYLVNLTFSTPIQTDLSLQDIFRHSKARYKLRYHDEFVFFSPETFVQIRDGYIYSYPMKGTIDAAIPNAASILLKDPKEMAEHVTIVDLIRNDLSQIATDVEVTKFRYLIEVVTHEKRLLQVSSEIRGKLMGDYEQRLGSLFFQLLPAGSISGAPKKQTLTIIEQAESHQRGFYTGVCGYFDGKDVDSGVMIRFIEKVGANLLYKSGGGITSFSDRDSEYREYIDKIYLPF